MTLRIVPYAAEHEAAVCAFNARLAGHNLDADLYSTTFPESHVPNWLPKRTECDLYQEYFVSLDDESVVRGGYILKHQPFLVRGELLRLAAFRLPMSEGIIDRRFINVAVQLYVDALRREPYLFGLGGGGYHVPVVKFLVAAGWQTVLVPFRFRVVRPNAFLRSIAALRTSAMRRGAFDLLGRSGLGWLGIKAIQGVRKKYRRHGRVTYETVDAFSTWADDVWNASKSCYALISMRDRNTLDILYPATDMRFVRLKVLRDRKVIGWAVMLNTQMSGHKQFGDMRVGTLIDCLAKPDDARDVVACARDFLEANGADLIVSNQASQAWCRGLKECGFLPGPSNFPFLASPKLAAHLQPFSEQAKTFHLNRAGGDGPIHL